MHLADIISWHIYFVPNCSYTTPPKDKYAVVACIDNGEIN